MCPAASCGSALLLLAVLCCGCFEKPQNHNCQLPRCAFCHSVLCAPPALALQVLQQPVCITTQGTGSPVTHFPSPCTMLLHKQGSRAFPAGTQHRKQHVARLSTRRCAQATQTPQQILEAAEKDLSPPFRVGFKAEQGLREGMEDSVSGFREPLAYHTHDPSSAEELKRAVSALQARAAAVRQSGVLRVPVSPQSGNQRGVPTQRALMPFHLCPACPQLHVEWDPQHQFLFAGCYDGHGGAAAAEWLKNNMLPTVKQLIKVCAHLRHAPAFFLAPNRLAA